MTCAETLPYQAIGLGRRKVSVEVVDRHVGNHPLGDLAKMPVMGQVDDLPHLRHLAQKPKDFFRARIVEALHDVVGDERHGRSDRRKFLETCQPQRKIELELRSGRHGICQF